MEIKATIISNICVAPGYFKATLKASPIAGEAKPGQFLHVKISDDWDPLLRRPFSIHRIRDSSVEILYRVVGKGTAILSRAKEGDMLDCLGPLGHGFSVDEKIDSVILVGGGIGVAPLLALAEAQSAERRAQSVVLIGAKTKDLVLCEEEFKELGLEVRISTEDGSYGEKGLATDLLEDFLSTLNTPSFHSGQVLSRTNVRDQLSTMIYACGPKPMLRKIAELTKVKRIPCQASLEERMGCGLGACLACAVKTRAGYKRVCKDGPVFDLAEIEWPNEDTIYGV